MGQRENVLILNLSSKIGGYRHRPCEIFESIIFHTVTNWSESLFVPSSKRIALRVGIQRNSCDQTRRNVSGESTPTNAISMIALSPRHEMLPLDLALLEEVLSSHLHCGIVGFRTTTHQIGLLKSI